jgi:hypothetical protein
LIAGYVAKHVGAPTTILMFGGLVLAGCVVFLWRVAFKLRDTSGAAVGTGVIEG